MTSNLAQMTKKAAGRPQRPRKPLVTRKPTGKPPWPMILLAGGEKAGKSYAAAVASASPRIGRTFWIGAGEDDPDEYGAIPGVRFEIVPHAGKYWDIVEAIDSAVAEPSDPDLPNLIVLDSGSRVWDMLSDEAQAIANERKGNGNYEAPIGMDLWNRATMRWNRIMDLLRSHNGPVIITARLETVTVMDDNGQPTKNKTSKVKGQKGLPFDVGVVVQMPRRGETYLTGVRSLKLDVAAEDRKPVDGFTVDWLWQRLGLEAGATSPRQHSATDGQGSAADAGADWIRLFSEAKGDPAKLAALREQGKTAGLPEDHGMFSAIEAELTHLAAPVEAV